jgi:hypothetical protein
VERHRPFKVLQAAAERVRKAEDAASPFVAPPVAYEQLQVFQQLPLHDIPHVSSHDQTQLGTSLAMQGALQSYWVSGQRSDSQRSPVISPRTVPRAA